MKKILKHLDKLEEHILFVFMTFMLIILSIQIFCRYFLSFSFSWAEQVSRMGFVWLTMAGISLAARRGLHLRIEVLPQLFPKSARFVNAFSDMVTIVFGFGMGYLILKTVIMQIELHQVFPSVTWLPTWTMYIAGVLGLFGLSVRTIQRVYFTDKAKPSEEVHI